MKMIILAAGMGERLFPLTKNTPKSLLDIGGGYTVLEHQLENIARCDIDEVIIVGGYRVQQIEARVLTFNDTPIRVIYNPFYDVSNNLVSAWFARSEMVDSDFVLMNGDNVFKAEVLEELLKSNDEISMLINRKDAYDSDDMKVCLRDKQVIKVSKKLPLEQTDGESVGMIRFVDRGGKKFVDMLDAMVREKENLNTFYLKALQNIMDDGFPVNFTECSHDDWAEIDFHPDLSTIRDNFSQYVHNVLDEDGKPKNAVEIKKKPQAKPAVSKA